MNRSPLLLKILLTGLASLLASVSLSCEQEAPPPPVTPAEPEPTQVHVEPVVSLLPRRQTLLSVDPAGSLFWLQRESGQPDVVFTRGRDGVPRRTGLSSTAILERLEVTQDAEGSIHSIAAGPQGQVWFYFQGGTDRRIIAAFGRYLVDSSELEIIADTDRIQALTGMGPSLDLARGTVIRSDNWLWLWIRHSDTAVLARLVPGELHQSQFHVDKSFTEIETAESPLPLTRSTYELSNGPQNELILLDRQWGDLWRIHPDGHAEAVQSLTGLPQDVSTPSFDRNGRIALFAAESDVFPFRSGEPYRPPIVQTTYPALLLVSGDNVTALGRDEFRAQAGAVTYRLRLQQLVIEPGKRTWLAYDEASGQLVRLQMR